MFPFLTASLLVMALGQAGGVRAVPPAPTPPTLAPIIMPGPRIEMGIRVGDPGVATQWAGTARTDVPGFAWMDAACAPNAGIAAPDRPPVAGWRFSSNVLRQEGDVVWVNVEWTRQWGGADASADTTQVHRAQLVARAGDRAVLDGLTATAGGPCAASAPHLEVTITRAGPLGSGSAAAARQPAAAAGYGGRGASTTTPVPPSMAAGGRGSGTTDARRGAAYAAELWLVHTGPDGAEDVQSMRLSFVPSGSAFSFPVVTIDTPRGPVSVTVSGTIAAALTNGAPSTLLLTLNRQVIGQDSPPTSKATGGTNKALEWPAPATVLSFELPSVMVSAGKEIVGHQFALRVRVATSAAQLLEEIHP